MNGLLTSKLQIIILLSLSAEASSNPLCSMYSCTKMAGANGRRHTRSCPSN